VGGVDTAAPSFDIVRVEPTGDTVIAGQAAPGATVELLDGDRTLATAEANERGEWAISLEAPLAPGAHDLAVRTTSRDKATVTLSDQRIAVSVPEKAGEEALVVLNTPDAASTVLQLPAAEKAPEAAPAEAPGAVAAAGEAAGGAAAGSAAGATTVVEAPGAETGAGVGTTAGEGAPGTAATGAASGDKDVAAVAPPPEPASSREAPAAGAAESAAAPGEAPAATPAVEEPKVEPGVALTAVEADTGGTLYVAGIAKTPETVRVYLDDEVLGEATPSPSGTWLLEVERELPAGRYAVRADQVDRLGNVIVRAEVPFERELEVASLRPVAAAGGSAGATVSGAMPAVQTVIIKRGDNLWRISRAMYGKGIRYSTIYQANRDQIRNARWIYPGQVFVVPTGDTTWTE
jgi:nucleoid-associated protein YgaU